jgi:tetratricopeptide (TPR) repeat protein
MQLHTGCFSMMVNYHAIGRYVTQRGGLYAATSRRQMNLQTAMCVLGADGADCADTLSMFRRRIEDFGPGDFFDLLHLERKAEKSLEQVLGLLKLSGYDPGVLYNYASLIRAQCKGLPEWLVVELRLAIDRVWSLYYASPQNLPFELGRILLALGRPLEAARFNQIAIDWFGEIPAAYLNMGICYYYAENPAQALHCFERATELNPDFGLSREWTARIQSERARAAHWSARSLAPRAKDPEA